MENDVCIKTCIYSRGPNTALEAGREGIIFHLQRGMLRLKEGHIVTWPRSPSWGAQCSLQKRAPKAEPWLPGQGLRVPKR